MSRTGIFALTFFGLCAIVFAVAVLFAIALFPKNSILTHSTVFIGASSQTSSPIDEYRSSAKRPSFSSNLTRDDARPVIVDNFLAKHNSPMTGMGKTFVFTADKYGIDWKLLPAIAFQESNLGKKIPRNSYNAWGWAVYTGKNSGVSFESWEHAIETVAIGIKERYISEGLTTPEAIMTKYTPSNDGSWAFGVRFAMDEMLQ